MSYSLALPLRASEASFLLPRRASAQLLRKQNITHLKLNAATFMKPCVPLDVELMLKVPFAASNQFAVLLTMEAFACVQLEAAENPVSIMVVPSKELGTARHRCVKPVQAAPRL